MLVAMEDPKHPPGEGELPTTDRPLPDWAEYWVEVGKYVAVQCPRCGQRGTKHVDSPPPLSLTQPDTYICESCRGVELVERMDLDLWQEIHRARLQSYFNAVATGVRVGGLSIGTMHRVIRALDAGVQPLSLRTTREGPG